MKYGALELSETGRPRFRDPSQCIECGVCYMICPVVGLLDEQVKKRIAWQPPLGKVVKLTVVRARDPNIRKRATDGGAVTAILTHLFERGEIDGAAVTRQISPFQRIPWLAMNSDEVLESAGSNFDRSGSGAITLYSRDYTSYAPQVRALGSIADKGLQRVALVGTPCQIHTVCKMQTLGVVPSDSIYCTLGLFCSGNYVFGDRRRAKVEAIGDFKWEDVVKMNIKESLILKLASGEERSIPLEELNFVKRKACEYCDDYTAEMADISFGGIGADDGWTTVIARSDLGSWILMESMQTVLEEHTVCQDEEAMQQLLEILEYHSHNKKEHAERWQESLSQAL
jgi:coenzyme F420 hydrogenase subunit beta